MKIKLSELKKMIKEEYTNVLAHEHPEDVDMLEKDWGLNPDKELVSKIDHKKASKVKENKKSKVRKLELSELKNMILSALHESKSKKSRKRK